jgi:CBS domain-containing protein
MRVRDVMTKGAIGVAETATLAEAVALMLRSRVNGLLVFDAERALVGVLSEGDLLRRSEIGAERRYPRWLELMLSGGRLAADYAHSHGRKVGEIMTREVITIGEDEELARAVELLIKRRIKRLPVLRGDAVAGILARSDILKGLLASLPQAGERRPDTEIRAAIEMELDKLGWAARASVRVGAENGVVTLDGAIIDERLRSGLRVIAENTPGVVAVHDRLCWIEPHSGIYIPSEPEEQDGEVRS